MKKLIFLILLISSASFLQAQAPSPSQLIKSAWSKILIEYCPKKPHTEVVSFDPDPKNVEWPILYLPENWEPGKSEFPEVDEIDRDKLKNFEYEFPTPLGWPSGGPVRALSEFFNYAATSIKYYKVITFENDYFDYKENFEKAFIQRYGSTKNIYCITNKSSSNPHDFVVAFFIMKNGVPKMVGFCMNYYTG